MKKTIKLINGLLIALLITTYSCKKDDDIVITLDDLEVTVDENPTDGQVIGTVQGNGSSSFTFSIDSQIPSGALNINPTTGELTVADPMLFDFETNPVITAIVSASEAQDTATVTINLNDVDEIVAQDVNINIDENPNGDQLIGALQATAGSNLTYTITFQNPAGAFAINQNTGQLYVDDSTLFDYETNPNMLATISISNGTYSVSKNAFVTLNDVNEIGEFKYGGVIFWVNATADEGLVCATTDQSTGIQWWNGSYGNSGATATAIGTGQSNTSAIVNFQGAGSYAAQLCHNLSLNGYDDWFLPSIGELKEMYINKEIINATSLQNSGTVIQETAFWSSSYWSSTESNSTSARILRFSDGSGFNNIQAITKATNNLNVRAIRAWTDF